MTEEAQKHEADDKKRREVIDLRNQADHLVYMSEKTLKEHGDKVGPQERANIESAINNLKEAAKGEDADAIRRAMENLNSASQEIGKKMYENVAGARGAAPGAGPQSAQAEGSGKSKGGEDVIDAEYEVKKDK